MYKVIEQYNKELDKIIYTVLDENNEVVCKFTSKGAAESWIKTETIIEGSN